MSYIALPEQTPGVPQGTQASRLLYVHLLFVMQVVMMVMMVMMMIQVHLHPLLLLVNETFESRCQMVQVCGPVMFVRSLWRRHW